MQPSIWLACFVTVALFTHIELVVPFHRAVLQPRGPQSMLHSWVMFSQVQDLTLVLAELHKVLVSPLYQPIEVFLQGGSSLRSIYFPTQFGIIRKLHQGALDPIIQITYEDIKWCWTQYQSLGDPTGDRLPDGKRAIYHHPLGVVCQPDPHLPHGPLVYTITHQFLLEEAVGMSLKYVDS
ncbi:mitochondrial enolase superfamily member 1 [Grus japonensis]|uniref:Mitochondrial enolase superfamily member 1 n=1 Tax=Grus japonensis TaxID=30415 RepID=A0ABC9WLW9_GRUJA